MGTEETGGSKVSANTEGPQSPRWKPPMGSGTALGSLFTLAAVTISVIYRGSLLGTDALTGITHWLFLGLAIGWVTRTMIHAMIGYFRRTEVEGAGPYVLPLVSTVNALFAIAWLCAAIFVVTETSGPATMALVMAIACLVSFVLALVTHWAAQKAKRPRASEKVRAKLRDPLDPGYSTPLGWLLVKSIDLRSPPHLLSTYVAGSLAVLLLGLVLTASAAISESAPGESRPGIGKSKATAPKGSQLSGPIVAEASPQGRAPTPAGLRVGGTKKAMDLFCFPINLSAPVPPSQHPASPVTFFCIIVVDDQLTNRFLILAPASLP
ncbi:MAG TPA: hypothetical protein VFY75_03780 [Solirubrobacterales bacterium]|nr:hypothetical protein [Solirubrobacterales bacterium]